MSQSKPSQNQAVLKELRTKLEDRIIAWQAIEREDDLEQLKLVMKIFPPGSVDIAHAQADTAILELQSVISEINSRTDSEGTTKSESAKAPAAESAQGGANR